MRPLHPFAALVALAASAAFAEPIEVARLSPAPLLDGSPAEWSSQPALPLRGDQGPASARLAHDRDHFFAYVEVTDPGPLRNSAARPQEMLKGGDAIALYFNHPDTGPQRVILGRLEGETLVYAHRPKSGVKRPHVFSSPVGSVAFDYVGPLADARAEFRTTPAGYSAEIALPWRALGFRAPPQDFGFDLQVIFSDPSGSTNAGFAWLHATEGPGLTVEDLPTEAALYPDTWGRARLVGTASLPPRAAAPAAGATAGQGIRLDLPRDGRLTLNITGKDGWILRELVRAEPRKAGPQTIVWDGRDRYGDLLPPGEYRWEALLFDGMGTRFLGSVGNSARPPYRTEDGRGSLGGQHGSHGVVAADAGGVYLGGGLQEGEPSFRKIDPATGVSLWKRSPGNFQSVLAVAAAEGQALLINSTGKSGSRGAVLVGVDPATGAALKIAGRSEIALETGIDEHPIADLAIAGNRAVYSVPSRRRLGVVDLKTGEKLADLPVEAWGLERLDANTLLACTRDSVVRLDLATGRTAPVVTGLRAPRDVAVEPRTGDLLVSDLGDRQQLLRFTADGRPLAALGRAGGRPPVLVPYDPMAFDNVTSLAFAADGTLWMKESSPVPRRFVRLSAEGRWLEDFCGPVAYNVFGPDLDDVSTIYYNPTPKHNTVFVEARVDYAGYAADPARPGNWRIVALHDLALAADGRTVNPLMHSVAETGYGHVIAFTAASGHRFLFRLSKPNRATAPDGAGLWIRRGDRWVPFAFFSADEKRSGRSWRDANGDGLAQDDERFTPPAYDRFAWIGRDLVLHGAEGLQAPASFDPEKLPVYAGGRFTPHLDAPSPFVSGGNVFPSPQVGGSVYYAVNSGPHRHLTFWDRATDNRVVKVTGGRIGWIAGVNNPRDHFASFSTLSGVAGVVDDLVLVHNVEPSTFVAYTTDGMVLGNVAADPDGSKPRVGGTAIYIEHFTGLFIKDAASGRRLLFYVVSGDDRIVEVTGPGRTDRFSGAVELPAGFLPGAGDHPVIPYAKLHGNVSRGLGIDGEDTEWNPGIPRLTLSDDGLPAADVRLRRDGGRLHVIADILDPTPMQAGEGLEIALARSAGGPAVVLSLVSDGQEPKGRRTWSGPVSIKRGAESADAPSVEVAASRRWLDLGYRIEASVPLTLLPEFSEPVEQTFRRDSIDPRTGKLGKLADVTETLPDLRPPLFAGLRVLRLVDGELRAALPAKPGLLPVSLPAAPAR